MNDAQTGTADEQQVAAQRIVISETYGGYGISDAGRDFLKVRGLDIDDAWDWYKRVDRDDPLLVEMVQTLGAAASTRYSNLVVVEIPHGVAWHVHEYDGYETLHENHRTWTTDGEYHQCM